MIFPLPLVHRRLFYGLMQNHVKASSGEGETPLNIRKDEFVEELAFSCMYAGVELKGITILSTCKTDILRFVELLFLLTYANFDHLTTAFRSYLKYFAEKLVPYVDLLIGRLGIISAKRDHLTCILFFG